MAAQGISEQSLPAELYPNFTTLEYTLPRTVPIHPPSYIFVLDTCVLEEELAGCRAALGQALQARPARPPACVGARRSRRGRPPACRRRGRQSAAGGAGPARPLHHAPLLSLALFCWRSPERNSHLHIPTPTPTPIRTHVRTRRCCRSTRTWGW